MFRDYFKGQDLPETLKNELGNQLEISNEFEDSFFQMDSYGKLANNSYVLEISLLKHFERMLDPEIYNKYILHGEKDKDNRYILPSVKNDPLYYYLNVLNLLKDARAFFTLVAGFREFAREHNLKKKTKWKATLELIQSRAELKKDADALKHALGNFEESIQAFRINHHYNQIFANEQSLIHQCDAIVNAFLPIESTKKHIQKNPVFITVENNVNPFRRFLNIKKSDLKKVSENLNTLEEALNGVLISLVGNNASRETLKKISETNYTIHRILENIKSFSSSSRSFFDIIALISETYPLLKKLSKGFPGTKTSVARTFQNHLFATIYQMNQILQDLYVQIDELETKFYLKEGYLISLSLGKTDTDKSLFRIGKEFSDWVERINCDFPEEERFPYSHAIAKKRKELLEAIKPSTSIYKPKPASIADENESKQVTVSRNNNIKKRKKLSAQNTLLLTDRVESGHKNVVAQEVIEQKKAIEFEQTSHRKEGFQIELIPGLNGTFDTSTLKPFKVYIYISHGSLQASFRNKNQIQHINLQKISVKLIYNEQEKSLPVKSLLPNFIYLYPFKSNVVGLKLRAAIKRNGLVEKIDLKLLDETLVESIKTKLLNKLALEPHEENAILTLAESQNLNTSGLDEKQVEDIWRSLCNSEKPSLTPALTSAFFELAKDFGVTPYQARKDAMISIIDKRINDLSSERSTSTNLKKQVVLKDLKAFVHISVEQSPSLYDQEQLYRKMNLINFDTKLLFQGRTGKMLKELKYLSGNRDDEIRLIAKKMDSLGQEIRRGFWFFKERREQSRTNRIEALNLLKQELKKPGYRLEDALDNLRIKHNKQFNILMRQDKDIVTELQLIDKQLSNEMIGKRRLEEIESTNPELLNMKLKLIDDRIQEIHEDKFRIRSGFFLLQNQRIQTLNNTVEALKQLKKWLGMPGYILETSLSTMEFSNKKMHKLIKDEFTLLEKIKKIEIMPHAISRAVI